jgi:uncharacterized protein (TIGR02757 family)
MKRKDLENFLNSEVEKRSSLCELSAEKPDPLMIARAEMCEYRALVCALFAYGNARAIVGFLSKLDFSLLDLRPDEITERVSPCVYRFQTHNDIMNFFIALAKMKRSHKLEEIFLQGYNGNDVVTGIGSLIKTIKEIHPFESKGYDFLVGSCTGNSPLKRWNMFLRWMVRDDGFDMGLWSKIDKRDLLVPLDTHTFHVGQKLGLIKRKTYDMRAAVELTNKLKKFDPTDPVKYDFALYRLGQEGIV